VCGSSSQKVPEILGIRSSLGLFHDDDLRQSLSFIIQSSGQLGSLHLLLRTSLASIPLVDIHSVVQNEDISRVEGVSRQFDLSNSHSLLSLEVEKSRLVFLGLNVVESRIDSTLQQSNLVVEVRKEHSRFVSLNFSVLDGGSSELVIQLDSLVGGSSSLILSGVLTQPEVDVPEKGVGVWLLVGVQDDVRISRVESSVRILGNRLDVELLDSPDLQSDGLASIVPSGFFGSSGFSNLLLKIGSEIGNV